MVGYYQWVPLILVASSIMAFIPSLIWRFFNLRSGIDVASIIESASTIQHSGYAELRERNVHYVVDQVNRYLTAQRDYADGCCVRQRRFIARYCFLVGGRRQGNYLTACYIFVKLLYLGNAVGQLYLLEYVLGVDYVLYGFSALSKAVRGEEWRLSNSFPRVTLCSFQVRHQSRVHDYVVQCALTINLFNEKIFLILWFWYVFVATVTVVSGATWTARAVYWPVQFQFVRSRIRELASGRGTYWASVAAFSQRYLRRDGLFIVRLVSANVGDLTATEILDGLWKNYCSPFGSSGSTGIRIETEVVQRESSTRFRTSGIGNSMKNLSRGGGYDIDAM